MIVKQFRVGGDRNFAYLAADESTGKALVVDPSYSPEDIVHYARENGFEIEYVFITHDHYDHSNGVREMERLTGRKPLFYGSTDAGSSVRVVDGASFRLGSLDVTVIHTPGHTSDSICILVSDALFTGDTLFVGKVGGTGFGKDARAQFESLHGKLMRLTDETRVFPGHDYGCAVESTIGRERSENPFILQPDFEAFVHLKRTWESYKKEHGIP